MATDMITQSNAASSATTATKAVNASSPSAYETGNSVQKDSRPLSPGELNAAVSKVADYVQSVQRNLNFWVDEASGETVVKVIDSNSDEVIRQFPSEEMLTLARRLDELSSEDIKGILVESKA